MIVKLSKEQYLIDESGRFNQKEALKIAGLKAAVCFKPGKFAPWDIRDAENEETLVRRGIDTVISEHATPAQQASVSLELYQVPKIVCMYLNNLGMQAADERSLRYTEVKPSEELNEYISQEEIDIYCKWLNKLQEVLWKDYENFFMMTNGGNEKKAKLAVKKIAQENARSFLSIFMPTSLTYTSNFSELNKLALQIEKTCNAENNTELEQLAQPYLEELLSHLKDLKVILTNEDVWNIQPSYAEKNNIPHNDHILGKDGKNLDLNLFSNKNKFSGIVMPDEFGVSFHATRPISFAGFAQLQRHRTLDTELKVPNSFSFYVPEFIKIYPEVVEEWMKDAEIVSDICYPQGQMILVSMEGTLKKLVNYVGGERACTRAQHEIAVFYLELLKDYYDALKEENSELASLLEPYVGKYRCLSKNYKCPSPCPGGPRMNRKF